MSDNILPLDIQTEIIKRVSDVESLVRFRSVSKPWKHFIDSSQFIAGYHARKTHPHSLLLRYTDNDNEVKYLSVSSRTFEVQQDLAPTVSDLMKQFAKNFTIVIGYSRGLLCMYSFKIPGTIILWNPSLRRSVGIFGTKYLDVFGFAVCPVTNEPTIVKISFPWEVQIFTLSSKKWSVIQCSKPRELINFHDRSHIVIGSCIYRVAYEKISLPDGNFIDQYMIISFDLIAKEFKVIDFPDKITIPFTSPVRFIISKLKGSVVVIVPHREVKVWKMEPDCSFTQLFTINTNDSYSISNIMGFRKNGELLLETQKGHGWDVFNAEGQGYALKVYDPCSQHIKDLEFPGQDGSFFVSSYKETLHLLNHSDSCVYAESNRSRR